jgi:hypothetical protein
LPPTHLDKHIPISILLKRIGIQNLVLADIPTSMSRLLLQLLVRELALGVLVKELHVRVGRGRIEVVVELLDIFSVVTWWSRMECQLCDVTAWTGNQPPTYLGFRSNRTTSP